MARLTDTVVSTITDTFFIAHNFWREISQTLNKEVSPMQKPEPASLTGGSVASAENGRGSGRLPAGAGSLPLLQSVSMVYVLFVAEVFFSCSHTVLPKEHSLGVIFFFSSLSSCYAVIFFNSLSSCPVYPLVIYVCYVWAG